MHFYRSSWTAWVLKVGQLRQCVCLLEALDHERGDPAESEVAKDVCGRLRAKLVFVGTVKLLHHP